MALTNAEKQAAHRAKKESVFEQISQELAVTTAENRDLRDKFAALEKKVLAMQARHKKEVASLNAKLVKAMENGTKA